MKVCIRTDDSQHNLSKMHLTFTESSDDTDGCPRWHPSDGLSNSSYICAFFSLLRNVHISSPRVFQCLGFCCVFLTSRCHSLMQPWAGSEPLCEMLWPYRLRNVSRTRMSVSPQPLCLFEFVASLRNQLWTALESALHVTLCCAARPRARSERQHIKHPHAITASWHLSQMI